MKTIISSFAIMLMAVCSFGQATVTFDYDDAGNRTQRVIVLPKESLPDSTLKTGDPIDLPATEMKDLTQSSIVGNTGITVWPNPSGGKFSVLISNENEFTEAKFTIHDFNGSQIIETSSRTLLNQFDLTGRPAGAYILSISVNGKTQTWKVIKQ